jgi:phosphoglycerate dehydrogenase-like enzyme
MTTTSGPVPIAVLDDYQGVALRFGPWDRLGAGVEVTVFRDHLHDEDALVQRLARFPIVVAMRERTPFPRQVLERLPQLRLLVTTGMANAAFDMAAAKQLGVVVSGTGGVPWPTAELTWALILGLVRHVADEDRLLRAGGWQRTVGTDLSGATLGLIGLGRLGSQVAAIGQAFGMQVIAWSQHLTAQRANALGVDAVSKEDLLRRADVISIHLQLSERTRGLIGAAELDLCQPTAYLVNTSRGPIVDEVALAHALQAGTLAGAGLDVFSVEPLPDDHPLRYAPRTLLTPHLGYVTAGTYDIFFTDAVNDIAAYLAGEPTRVLNG